MAAWRVGGVYTPAILEPYSIYALAAGGKGRRSVEGAGNFGLGQVGKLAELGDGNEGPRGLAQLAADALEEHLGGAVLGAGELGHLCGVDANLGHSGRAWGKRGKRRYNR